LSSGYAVVSYLFAPHEVPLGWSCAGAALVFAAVGIKRYVLHMICTTASPTLFFAAVSLGLFLCSTDAGCCLVAAAAGAAAAAAAAAQGDYNMTRLCADTVADECLQRMSSDVSAQLAQLCSAVWDIAATVPVVQRSLACPQCGNAAASNAMAMVASRSLKLKCHCQQSAMLGATRAHTGTATQRQRALCAVTNMSHIFRNTPLLLLLLLLLLQACVIQLIDRLLSSATAAAAPGSHHTAVLAAAIAVPVAAVLLLSAAAALLLMRKRQQQQRRRLPGPRGSSKKGSKEVDGAETMEGSSSRHGSAGNK
jgi:hypothetical protein